MHTRQPPLSQLSLFTQGGQRWREGRHTFVLPRAPINTRDYEIAEIEGDNEAKAFCTIHHYLRSYPAARRRFGIYHHGQLQGVAIYAQPGHNQSGISIYGGSHLQTVELKRLVLLDEVPYNAESFFIQNTFDVLKQSFIKQKPRRGLDWKPHESGHFFALAGEQLYHAPPKDHVGEPNTELADVVRTAHGKVITRRLRGIIVKKSKTFLRLEGFDELVLRSIKRTLQREWKFRGVLAFADPMRRTRLDGSVLIAGHVGSVYSALGGFMTHRTRRRKIKLLPDGSTFNERMLSKMRAQDSGWRAGLTVLEAHGADPLGEGDDVNTYLDFWLPKLTRIYAHPGNFCWAFPLRYEVRRRMAPSRPYPKEDFDLYYPPEDLRRAA